MARSHLYRPIQDAQGNLRRNAIVRVFDAGLGTLTSVPLYASNVGNVVKPAVHTVPNGIIDIYTDEPQRFRIGIKVGDEPEVLFDNVDVLEPSLPLDAAIGIGTQNNVAKVDVFTATTTLTGFNHHVLFNGTDLSCVLPSPGDRLGRTFVIKNLHTTPLAVSGPVGLIDGDASRTLGQYDVLAIISDGENWSVV